MGARELEAELLFVEQLRSRFEGEGFTFNAHPETAQLPAFLGKYTPDAVAQKGDLKIAIEVKSRQTPSAQQNLRQIRHLFDGQSDWRLRVIFTNGEPEDAAMISTSTPAMVREGVAKTRALLNQKQRQAAFVASWSLLEAAFRIIGDASDGRPYDPGTVVQTLAMNGHITPELERQIRELIDLRNRVVHGDLEADPSNEQVELILSAIESVLSDAAADAAAH